MKFNNLSHDEKLEIKKLVVDCIDTIGGINYFLKMIEDIKEATNHPLLNKTAKFHFKNGTISWEKQIFKEKVLALKKLLLNNSEDENILNIDDIKLKKEISNTIKVMGKLVFVIKTNEGEYSFSAFNTINDTNVELDPLFQIIFFDSLNNTKRIYKYK
ncbi:MAG: hypothetical protein U9O56_01000 [Campylobacterota bacterium]|nr:hypothetical protein [Campylobacterota bacterium]